MSPYGSMYIKWMSIKWLHIGAVCRVSVLYVALNQTSTHYVDFPMGTKPDTPEYRPGLSKEVCVHRPDAGYFPSEGQVPFKPAAGHCRTSGMCTWRRKKKCLNNWRREGRLHFSFCTLHREIIGLSKTDSVTSFCEFHTKEQITERARGRGRLGQWNIFTTWYLIYKEL